MKRFKFTIHQYRGEDGYQKPHPVAEFEMKVIDDDMAYELAEAIGPILPWDGFAMQEEIQDDNSNSVVGTCIPNNPDVASDS